MSKLDFKFKDKKLLIGIDSNEDGENSIDIELFLSEAFSEAMSRDQAIPGAKLVSLSFEDKKMKVVIDTDRDGEPLMIFRLDLAETFEEVVDSFKKDKPAE